MLDLRNEVLAIDGGIPTRNSFLPYGRHWIDEADVEAVANVLRSDFIATGPKIQEFEENLAYEVGTQYAVVFSSGTAALHAACFASNIMHGDEVVTTALTFVASSNCILYSGGTPTFVDIRSDTYNIDPEAIKRRINKRTKAFLIVDFAGQPAQYNHINQIAFDNNIITIRDAAHSLGSKYYNRKVGESTDLTVLSFHPVKNITTGEGGAVVTNSKFFYKKLKEFRNHGIVRNIEFLTQKTQSKWYYEMQSLGYNYRLTDFQAALGISQLKKLNTFNKRRNEIVETYNSAFHSLKGLRTQKQLENHDSSNHLYILRWETAAFKVMRNQIYNALIQENIGVNLHYQPVYLHPYYRSLGYQKGMCPQAENLYSEMLTIPLYPLMTDQDVKDVITAVAKVHAAYVN